MKQNLIRGFVFCTTLSVVYILIQCFVFEEQFDNKLIISAVVSSVLAWLLLPVFERILKRKENKRW